MTKTDIYHKLADMIDEEDIVGMAKTPALLRLLSLQFTPEEAQLALQVHLTGGTLDEIAERAMRDQPFYGGKTFLDVVLGREQLKYPLQRIPLSRQSGGGVPCFLTHIWQIAFLSCDPAHRPRRPWLRGVHQAYTWRLPRSHAPHHRLRG